MQNFSAGVSLTVASLGVGMMFGLPSEWGILLVVLGLIGLPLIYSKEIGAWFNRAARIRRRGIQQQRRERERSENALIDSTLQMPMMHDVSFDSATGIVSATIRLPRVNRREQFKRVIRRFGRRLTRKQQGR